MCMYAIPALYTIFQFHMVTVVSRYTEPLLYRTSAYTEQLYLVIERFYPVTGPLLFRTSGYTKQFSRTLMVSVLLEATVLSFGGLQLSSRELAHARLRLCSEPDLKKNVEHMTCGMQIAGQSHSHRSLCTLAQCSFSRTFSALVVVGGTATPSSVKFFF